MERILLDKSDHIAVVTINRPQNLNALAPDDSVALVAAFDDALADETIRVIVLTGAGTRAFSAGADIKWLDANPDATPSAWMHRERLLMKPVRKPLIAAVCGYCLGGGFELALMADLIVASTTAVFGFPEAASIGSYPGDGGPFRIVRQLPHRIAMDLLLTGRRMDAAEAYRYGLVNEIVALDVLMDAANAKASAIAAHAPVAIELAKALALESLDLPLAIADGRRSAWDLYPPAEVELHASDDWRHNEAAAARRNGRLPRFTGRRNRQT